MRGLQLFTMVAMASGACAHATDVRTASLQPMCVSPSRVPAGTQVRVQLNESMPFSQVYPGQSFTGDLVTPLRGRDGCDVAAPGALVEGTVVAVDSGATHAIRLDFDRVDTVFGSVPFRAAVVGEQRVGATRVVPPLSNERASFDATITPAAIGGGPGARVAVPGLAVGAVIDLVVLRAMRFE